MTLPRIVQHGYLGSVARFSSHPDTGTNTLPIIPWFFVPLRIGERTLGVVGVAKDKDAALLDSEARALLDTSTLTQEADREKMRVATNRYGEKAALLSDILQQEAAVAQADADYQKALAAFWSAKANFDYALGRN